MWMARRYRPRRVDWVYGAVGMVRAVPPFVMVSVWVLAAGRIPHGEGAMLVAFDAVFLSAVGMMTGRLQRAIERAGMEKHVMTAYAKGTPGAGSCGAM